MSVCLDNNHGHLFSVTENMEYFDKISRLTCDDIFCFHNFLSIY